MSHYLLDMGNLLTKLDNEYRYRISLYGEFDASRPRESRYKTKYLKTYKTHLLANLPLSIFQDKNGYWLDYNF